VCYFWWGELIEFGEEYWCGCVIFSEFGGLMGFDEEYRFLCVIFGA
jgi:hypothetical protein